MVTVLRSGGLRVVIYLDDHEPAHVHVVGDGEAKIDLGAAVDEPVLVWSVGFSNADVRRAYRLVREHLIAKWRELHG
jgi:uncharacterized protein DUF4160